MDICHHIALLVKRLGGKPHSHAEFLLVPESYKAGNRKCDNYKSKVSIQSLRSFSCANVLTLVKANPQKASLA